MLELANCREDDHQKALHRRVVSGVLLGAENPWTDPGFQAFQTGFNIELKEGRSMLDVRNSDNCSMHSSIFYQSIHVVPKSTLPARQLILALCDHHIRKVDEVKSMIEFTTKDKKTTINNTIFSLVQYHVLRWIQGVGHPASTRGQSVEVDLHDEEANDPLVRARLMLLAMTDCPMLPASPYVKLKVWSNRSALSPLIYMLLSRSI